DPQPGGLRYTPETRCLFLRSAPLRGAAICERPPVSFRLITQRPNAPGHQKLLHPKEGCTRKKEILRFWILPSDFFKLRYSSFEFLIKTPFPRFTLVIKLLIEPCRDLSAPVESTARPNSVAVPAPS